MRPRRARWENLLKLRRIERDQCRQRYLQAVRAEEILQQELLQLQRTTAELALTARQSAQPGSLDVDRLLDAERYHVVLQQRRTQITQQLAQIQAAVSLRRQEMIAAEQSVKMLEKLQERRTQEERQAELRSEQKQLDNLLPRHDKGEPWAEY